MSSIQEHEDLEKRAAKVRVRRGPWSPAEDRKLLDIITVCGPSNWVRISISLGSRSPKQCRERYHQNLKPSLNRNPITYEEGLTIEQLVAKHGKKWAVIARHLTGRSDNAIKNWWNGGVNRRRRRASLETGYVVGAGPKPPAAQGSVTARPSVSAGAGSYNEPSENNAPAPQNQPYFPPQMPADHHPMPFPGGMHEPALVPAMGPVPKFPPADYGAQKLPQIDFNTAIFNNPKRFNSLSYHKPLRHQNSLPSMPTVGSAHEKKPDISRSISMDSTSLQPLPVFNKARFTETRRHSLNLAPLVPTSPAVYTAHPAHAISGLAEHSEPSGSRHSSLSLYDYAGNRTLAMTGSNASSALNSRRTSVAPDNFPKYSAGLLNVDYARNHSSSSLSSGDAAQAPGAEKSVIPTFKNLMKSIATGPQEDEQGGAKRMSVASLMN